MKKFKILFSLSSALFLLGGLLDSISESSFLATEVKADDSDKYNQYIGYGYDVTSGPLYDTANVLHLSNPILNVDSIALKNKIKHFTPSRVTYTSGSYNSKSEVAEHLGKEISGAAGASANANIGPIVTTNVDISASFNTANTESWKSVQQETFSYHNIYAQNRTVTLQLDPDDDSFSSYLDPTFLKDAKKITSPQGADIFLAKYGTHLMMGYTLGGVFEMTNYYATNSSSYVKENTTSFDTQVSAGLSVAGGKGGANTSGSFSFTQTYGLSDNNAYATNQYKLQTFGGKVFPGLTIDQAFSYYETAFGAGYMYNIWTDSINDGDNLVIVNVPTNTPLVPLYRLLPSTEEYQTAKEQLLASYLKQCSSKLAKYRKNNKDVGITDMRDPADNDNTNPSLKINGYDLYSLTDEKTENNKNYYYYSYNSIESNGNELVVNAKPKDVIRFDYETTNLDGVKLVWKVKEKKDWYELDSETGLIKIKETGKGETLTLNCKTENEAVTFAAVKIIIDRNTFGGGDGSENNPYLISSASQLDKIGEMFKTNKDGKTKYFKLVCDIDLTGIILGKTGADQNNPFNWVIDGNYHSISNYTVNTLGDSDKDSYTMVGFVSCLGEKGIIKNLTLKNSNINIVGQKANSLHRIGLLVANSFGQVDNCHIRDSKIRIISTTNQVANSTKSICVGGLVGKQEKAGFVKNSSVNAVSITVETNNIQNTVAGALIGEKYSEKANLIERCSVVDSSVNVTSQTTDANDKNIRNYVGGFVGYNSGYGSKYSNCLMTGTSVYLNDKTSIATTSRENYLGGFIGYYSFADKNYENVSFFENILVNLKACSIDFNNKTNIGNIGFKRGTFIGKISDLFTKDQMPGNDVVVYNSPEPTVYVGNKTFDYISNDVSLVNSFDSEYWDSNKNENRRIKYKYVDSIELDFSNAPKTFKYNQEFSTGNGIIIQRYFADGSDMEELTDYYVDYSEYKKDVPDSYTIYVTAYGVTDSYTVIVEGPVLLSIKLENKPDVSYYAGDPFVFKRKDGETQQLYAYYSDGSKKPLALDDPDLIIDAPNKLAVGQNKITYSYKGVSTYLVVEATELKVKSYKIKNKSDLENRTYQIKDKNVDLSGMEIEVSYENADTRIVKYDDNEEDFSTYYSKFKYGANEIKISYKDYTMSSIVIKVAYSSGFKSKVDEFVSIVRDLSSDKVASDMSLQFSLIKKAEKLRNEIGNFTGDADYDLACKTFEEYKLKYNNQVDTINADFDSVVELNSSFIYGSTFNVTIPFSIAAIIILFFVL